MKEILLKNGSTEADTIVAGVMMSLERLWEDDALTVYDLHEKCNNSDYEMFPSHKKRVVNSGLMDNRGIIHSSIRNVVLSAVASEGMDMTLGSPVA